MAPVMSVITTLASAATHERIATCATFLPPWIKRAAIIAVATAATVTVAKALTDNSAPPTEIDRVDDEHSSALEDAARLALDEAELMAEDESRRKRELEQDQQLDAIIFNGGDSSSSSGDCSDVGSEEQPNDADEWSAIIEENTQKVDNDKETHTEDGNPPNRTEVSPVIATFHEVVDSQRKCEDSLGNSPTSTSTKKLPPVIQNSHQQDHQQQQPAADLDLDLETKINRNVDRDDHTEVAQRLHRMIVKNDELRARIAVVENELEEERALLREDAEVAELNAKAKQFACSYIDVVRAKITRVKKKTLDVSTENKADHHASKDALTRLNRQEHSTKQKIEAVQNHMLDLYRTESTL